MILSTFTRRAACVFCASAAFLVSGCANMSGLDGTAEYGCKAPQGVQCESVSGNYFNAIQNNLPSQRQGRANEGEPQKTQKRAAPDSRVTAPLTNVNARTDNALTAVALPLRSQARVLRLWFKPWEDADHDLYDQGYVYVQIDGGRWQIDHAQQRIRDAYAPIRAPRTAPAQSASTTAKANEAAAAPRPPANAIPPLQALTGSGNGAGMDTQ